MESTAPIPLDADLLCGGCRQNLRGVASDRCPECGRRFDRGHFLSPAVPWEHRGHFGAIPALWRTVFLVTFQPSRLIDAALPTVTLGGARSFRRWIVAWVFVASLGEFIAWRLLNTPGPRAPLLWPFTIGEAERSFSDIIHLLHNAAFAVVSAIAVLLWVIALTQAPTVFFRQGRNRAADETRAVAVALYACGALAWIPLLVFLPIIATCRGWQFTDSPAERNSPAMIAVILVGGLLCIRAWAMIRLVHRVTGSQIRQLAILVLLPLIDVCLAVFIFVGMHFIVSFIVLLSRAAR